MRTLLRGFCTFVVALPTTAGIGACQNDGPYDLDRHGGSVRVTEIYRQCASDDDCVLANVTCNGCCTEESIATSLARKFEAAKHEACASYDGPVCDCEPPRLTARCQAGLCVAEEVLAADAGPQADDPCLQLEGAYESVERLECGINPDGPVLCNWSLTFRAGKFSWLYSDVGETGTYTCIDGSVLATGSGGATYEGKIDRDRSLRFDARLYQPAP